MDIFNTRHHVQQSETSLGEELYEFYMKLPNGSKKTAFTSFMRDYLTHHHGNDRTDAIQKFIEYNSISGKVRLEKFVIRYGSEEAARKWQIYRQKQSTTNTKEYKRAKYGWSDDDFMQYNLSRACTEANLIKRHGPVIGAAKWKDYVETQRTAGCTEDYFISKYGIDLGIQEYRKVCAKKNLFDIDNFKRLYGDNDIDIKFKAYISKMSVKWASKNSQNLFDAIYERLSTEIHPYIFYYNLNNEYTFKSKQSLRCYYVDFYDIIQNKVIEFNGDYFHCNPELYKDTYINKRLNLTAKDIWQKDSEKKRCLVDEFGCSVMYIWESEWKASPSKVIDKCLDFLKNEENNN